MIYRFERGFFDIDQFREILFESARTLVRLPAQRPDGFRNAWPDYLPDFSTGYGYEIASFRPDPPSGRAIDRLDRVLAIIAKRPEDGRLAMAVALSAQRNGQPRDRGPQWKRTARRFNIHADTLKTRFEAATERLAVLWYKEARQR
jgi:hypothetical protein